jgi:hypothetical protein
VKHERSTSDASCVASTAEGDVEFLLM